MKAYYEDDQVALYCGDSRELIPALGLTADCVVTDPPYGETSLAWDRWPDGWPTLAATVARSMWCFGSMRMLLDRGPEFTAAGWKLSQDVVWEKQNGSGFMADRFKRVHEFVTHWYLGPWGKQHHDVPREQYEGPDRGVRHRGPDRGDHLGTIRARHYEDQGTRLIRSVLRVRNLHKRSLHPTEKPIGILDPLIRYACPPGGTVLDLFAGSGSTLDAARQCGRRAIGVEANEKYAEAAARRLSNLTLEAL